MPPSLSIKCEWIDQPGADDPLERQTWADLRVFVSGRAMTGASGIARCVTSGRRSSCRCFPSFAGSCATGGYCSTKHAAGRRCRPRTNSSRRSSASGWAGTRCGPQNPGCSFRDCASSATAGRCAST